MGSLQELGYPEIKTLDDMVDVLGQMKEICPTDDNGKQLMVFPYSTTGTETL